MKKIRTILINEIVTVISRPSFWLTALGLPLLASLVFGVVGRINQSSTGSQAIGQILTGPVEPHPEGYVDLAGLIDELPSSTPAGSLLPFPDEAAARQALAEGKIAAFYIVPKDYLQKGQVLYIRPDFTPLASAGDQSGLFLFALHVNLLGGDWKLANLVQGPLEVQDVSLAPPEQNRPVEYNSAAFWLPYGVTLLFYFLIMGSSSLLLSNVSKEKENRVMETLLTAVSPLQLLTGKILGLGIVGLGQTILWLGTGYALMNLSGRTFNLPIDLHLPFSLVVWGILFFLLGYAVYASLMAGLGALAPNLREASQVTMVIMIPLIIPLFFASSVFTMEPNSTIPVVLSLFPLSAPVAMMARLAAGISPWWHVPLSALLLALTAVFTVRAVAGMFRAQALLSGQGIKVKTYLRALMGKS